MKLLTDGAPYAVLRLWRAYSIHELHTSLGAAEMVGNALERRSHSHHSGTSL